MERSESPRPHSSSKEVHAIRQVIRSTQQQLSELKLQFPELSDATGKRPALVVEEENELYRRLEDLRRREQFLIAREAPDYDRELISHSSPPDFLISPSSPLSPMSLGGSHGPPTPPPQSFHPPIASSLSYFPGSSNQQHPPLHPSLSAVPTSSSRPGTSLIRVFLPEDQRTAVSARPGVSIKQALKKAMHHRNLTTAESLVSVSQKGKPKMFLDWNTDTTLLCGQEVFVESKSTYKFKQNTPSHHNLVRKTFITLAFCDVCKKLLFRGFRCETCGFRYHQRCAPRVPIRCSYYDDDVLYQYLLSGQPTPVILQQSHSPKILQLQQESVLLDSATGSDSEGSHISEVDDMDQHSKEIDLQLENLLEKYRHQRKIKHKSLKCLFTGPPRVGKTTLKKRLLKVIKNLITSGIVSPSGGLEKPITVVIGETRECVTVVMESDRLADWQPQHSLLDEVQIVLEFIDQQPISHCSDSPTPAPDLPTSGLDPSMPSPVPPIPVSPALIPSTPVPLDLSTPDKADDDTLDDVKKLIREVLATRKLRNIMDIEKTTTLYFMDTGGQPEFHEIMPIIFNGPALHLVFFNLAFNLDNPIPIRFCHQDGTDSLITYNSSYTGKQMIFQLLSNLYYLSKDLSPQCEPAAVLIATHLDQLKDLEGQEENKMEEINDTLKELLSNVEFHDQAFLTYPKKDEKSTIFIPVNNYSGDDEEIQQLQAFLRQVIDERFDAVELPSSWLLFHLILRHRYENASGVCTLADCRALAGGCGLDEKDVPQVLRYIHQILGTILFYEDVQGLNELVICDPNVLFRSIYQLVAVSFGGDKCQHTITTEIRKTGEISVRVLERIGTHPSSSLLTNEHIIELLKHFKLLTELHSDDRLVYFMPCLLQSDESFQLPSDRLQALSPPFSLLVRFDGNYIPIGVFSALVVKLSQSSWEPDRDSRYRNHLLFHTDGPFPVELIVHSAYLEFHIRITSYEEEQEEIHQFCMEVRKTVVNTLKSILDLHAHTKNTKFQLGFYCPSSFQAGGTPHFCGCLPRHNHINPKSFVCTKSPRCQDQCRLPHEYTIWFDYWKVSKETARDRGHACETEIRATQSSAVTDVSLVDSTPLEQCSLKTALDSISTLTAEWFNLGLALRLSPDTLREIEYNHPRDARRCLTEMVIAWLQMKDNSQPSWQSLVYALSSPAVGRIEIASMIAAEHPLQTTED